MPMLGTKERRPPIGIELKLRYALLLVAYLVGIYLLSSLPDMKILAGVTRISELVGIQWLSPLPDAGVGSGGPVFSNPGVRGGNAVVRHTLNLSHIPLFAGLAFCLLRALSGGDGRRQVTWGLLGLTFLATAVLAVLDEWHQSFVPGRSPRVKDFFLDLLGSGGMLLFLRFRKETAVLKTFWSKLLLVLRKIGYFQSQLIFALVYFVVIAPFALAVRLFTDPMRLRGNPCWYQLPRDSQPPPVLDSARKQS